MTATTDEQTTGPDVRLYILMRTDIPSMNHGKSIAQGAHAADQCKFTLNWAVQNGDSQAAYFGEDGQKKLWELKEAWEKQANLPLDDPTLLLDPITRAGRVAKPDTPVAGDVTRGFGTTITLDVNHARMMGVLRVANDLRMIAAPVVDPTYPFAVNREIFELLDKSKLTSPPVFRGDTVFCTRREITCGFVFGVKDDVTPILSQFDLHP